MKTRTLLSIVRVIPVTVFLVLAGAACFMSLQSRLEKEAKIIAEIVRAYCDETTSPQLRQAFRYETNQQAAPDHVVVTCRAYPPAIGAEPLPDVADEKE